MKKILILCFIHGFKGGESTFGDNYRFTEDLRALVQRELSKDVEVRVLVYPKYETRGNLAEAVGAFREWLEEKVIDLEVHLRTPSPTVSPSVRTILLGHSMGGIMAAETVVALTSEHPIHSEPSSDPNAPLAIAAPPASSSSPAFGDLLGLEQDTQQQHQALKLDDKDPGPARAVARRAPPAPPGLAGAAAALSLSQASKPSPSSTSTSQPQPPPSAAEAPPLNPDLSTLMFPYIQATLSFDTPHLGISPGVLAHNAEEKYNVASNTITQLSGLASATGLFSSTAATTAAAASSSAKKPVGALMPTPEKKKQQQQGKTGAGGGWGINWGTLATIATASAALAGAGAAAYVHRENLVAGATWVSSHLEFVGCLARPGEMRRRVEYMVRVRREMGVGFANLYTRIGQGTGTGRTGVGGAVAGGAPPAAGLAGLLTADGKGFGGLGGGVMGAMITKAATGAATGGSGDGGGGGEERTFCILPRKGEDLGVWVEEANGKAGDEIGAHMNMFDPGQNPGYRKLVQDARDMIVGWTKEDQWYSEGSIS